MASKQQRETGAGQDAARGDALFLQEQRRLFEAGFSFSGYERDLLALNLGNGRFLDISGVSGADSVSDGRAAVWADLDNDGDPDLFLRAMHGPAHLLYRNEVGQDHGFLRVTLEGRESGRDAFGAVVRLKTGLGVQTRVKSGGSGFLSQPDPRLLFGLGDGGAIEWIEVAWPSGRRERLPGPPAGSSLRLVEGAIAAAASGSGTRPGAVPERRFSLPDPRPTPAGAWRLVTVAPGDPLPPLTVQDLQGADVALSSLLQPGRRTLINFWATWCQPCAEEMPVLQRLHDSASAGLQVVGISVDFPADRDKIPGFLKMLEIRYPNHVADAAALESLFTGGGIEIPVSILVDAEGRVQQVHSGWGSTARQHLEALAAGE